MKALFILSAFVFALSANADISTKFPSASSDISFQDAHDLIAFLHSEAIQGDPDVMGNEKINVTVSVKFDRVKCGQGTLSYSGYAYIERPEREEQDDRMHPNNDVVFLGRDADQCKPNSQAEKFLHYMEKFGAKTVEPSVIDTIGFVISCGTSTPRDTAAYQWCSVNTQRDLFVPSSTLDGGTRISPGVFDGRID